MYDPNKAKVLWSKGQNFFAAFFAEIAIARKAINDDRIFATWCFTDLHIPLGAITRIADVLSATDAAIAKADLAAARKAEQEQKRKERGEHAIMVAAERRRKEEEKAAAAAEKARQRELDRQAERQARKQTSKRRRDAAWREKKRTEKAAALAALALQAANVVPFVMKPLLNELDLVKRIRAALDRRDSSRDTWIDASVELAGLLCEARARYPAPQHFGKWCRENDININSDDRAALLNLGLDTTAMRVFLQQTKSTSYQTIWDGVKLRLENQQNKVS